MPTSNTEELGRFLKCTVIGRGVFGLCACCCHRLYQNNKRVDGTLAHIMSHTLVWGGILAKYRVGIPPLLRGILDRFLIYP